VKHVLAAALLVAASVLPAAAAPITFTAFLSGPNESPANASPGTGFTTVTIDAVAHTMRVEVSFDALTANNTAAHIHVINGPNDANVADTLGPVTTTVPTFTGFPVGTFGTYDQTFDMTLATSFNPSFVTAAGGIPQAELALFAGIASGRAYLNIHTSNFPGGEIRGFLQPTAVPEPSAMLLVGTGLLAMFARRRMRTTRS
jgi:hypothetical protein